MYPLIRRYLRRVDVFYLLLCAACSALSVVVLVSIGQTQLGSNNKASVQLIASLLGLMLAVLGVIILRNPGQAMSFLCLMLGIATMADGLFKLQSALDARRFGLKSWPLILTLAVGAGVVGALLMLRPMQSARALTVLLGIGMMLEGVLNLCVALFGIKIIRHQRVDGAECRVE